jgi:hypothetical protein
MRSRSEAGHSLRHTQLKQRPTADDPGVCSWSGDVLGLTMIRSHWYLNVQEAILFEANTQSIVSNPVFTWVPKVENSSFLHKRLQMQ